MTRGLQPDKACGFQAHVRIAVFDGAVLVFQWNRPAVIALGLRLCMSSHREVLM